MKFHKTEKKLKEDLRITIKEAEITDAKKLLMVVSEYVEESEFVPYTKGEFNLSVEDEEKWIDSFLKSDNSILLLAEHDGQIVGNISINGSTRKIMSHTACIGIGLLKDWRSMGIGTALFDEAINWAKMNPIIEILWLETYSTNKNGLSLYQKFGFKETGRQARFIKQSRYEYTDNVTMTLNIKQ